MRKTLRNLVLAVIGAAVALALATGLAHAASHRNNSGAPAARMYGDPAAAAPYWRHQSYDDCALMAAADVIGQLTGREPSEQEIIAVAQRLGSRTHPGPIYTMPSSERDPSSVSYGTDPDDIPVLLSQYRIYGVVTTDSGMEALERYLADGHKVIAGVNAELIWGIPVQTTDGSGNPTSDHAVVVTGVDLVNGKVHLNDSASPNGPDEVVSIELFKRAWAAGSNEMVVTRETA